MLQPPEKRPRKSAGDKRVSFGAVSVHLIEKADASVASATRRRSSVGGPRGPSFSSVPETDGLPEVVPGDCQVLEPGSVADSENLPPTQYPPPPPMSHSPHVEIVDQRLSLPPQSPAASEASDLFFSPQESVSGPSPACTPSLRGLLSDDEKEETCAYAPSFILQEDEEALNGNGTEVDMDITMTMGVGSVSVPLPTVTLTGKDDAQDRKDCQASPTCRTGGAKFVAPAIARVEMAVLPSAAVAMPAPTPAPSPVSTTFAAQPVPDLAADRAHSPVPAPPSSVSEVSSENEESLAAKQDSVPKELRRYSFSQKLAAVSNRLFRYALAETAAAASANYGNESEEVETSEKGDYHAVSTVKGLGVEETIAVLPVASFDKYLKEAGVIFLEESNGQRHASLGPSKALAGLLDHEGEGQGEALANQLMGACVLQPELEQLDWAGKELSKCITMLSDGYLKMEEYVVQNAPTFFSAPETKVPAAQLKKLRNRSRQTARIFWYDWRATLESDLSNKLHRAEQCFEADLARLREHNSRLLQLQAQLDAATPALVDECLISMKSAELSQLELSTAAREGIMTRMEKKRAALQEQVRLAVSVLETVHEGHALQQHRLSQLETKMHERTEPVSCKKFATLQGEELLDALQAAVCWRPLELSSSRVLLRFGDHFEVLADFATNAPKDSSVVSMLLRSLLPPQMSKVAGQRPELQLLHAGFGRIQVETSGELVACRSLVQLRTLMQKLSLRLGRLLDLADEVQALATRRLLRIEPDRNGSGVKLTMRLLCTQLCLRFTLTLALPSERPDLPMQWHVKDWQQLQETATAVHCLADSLRDSVGIICEQHRRGLSRLSNINDALDETLGTTRLLGNCN